MENFFLAMYDCPENVHGVMSLLQKNAVNISRWAEKEKLLVQNTGNQCTCGTCMNFSNEFPTDCNHEDVKLSDMWVGMDSQETVGVSPDLFHELIFPYYRDMAKLFGQVYWGCCEPIDPIWEKSISNLPNLKLVSISRWTDKNFMADALNGRKIVYSCKPNPNILGVGENLDEDAWRNELKSHLEAVKSKDVPIQFVVRDVYSLGGNLDKARRAVEIAREVIGEYY
jgi:hypothetical protein